MESISSFFQELKIRFSNPFLTSYFISWIIINWQIPIGLLFYDIEELKIDGYKSYLNLIETTVNVQRTFLLPLVGAITYTIVFPFIRNLISAFNAWTTSWGESWVLNISNSGKISVTKYLALRSANDQKSKALEEVLSKESSIIAENTELRNEISELNRKNQSLSEVLKEWQTATDSSPLNGEWEYSSINSTRDRKIIKISIIGGAITDYENQSENKQTILTYYKPPFENRLVLIIESYTDDRSMNKIYKYLSLTIMDDFKFLQGTINYKDRVEFKKILR